LQALARTADFHELGPISLQLLGTGLNAAGDRTAAESVLRRAQERHPRDVWINHELGSVLESLSQADEAIRFYTAARAIRPETAHKLAHALEKRGRSHEAIAVFRDLKELRPGNAKNLECLGDLLKEKGRSREAGEVFELALAARREEIRLKPGDAHARLHLAKLLKKQGKVDEAVAAYRAAIRLKPDEAYAHSEVGVILASQGKLDEAIAECREAIRLQPDSAAAHNHLGIVLCDVKRDYPAAEAALREAIRLQPDDGKTHHNLGVALEHQGKVDEAVAEFRAAIRHQPDDARAHYILGDTLKGLGKFDEAIAEYRTAIRLQPDFAEAHNDLGAVLCDVKRDYPAAEAAFREAIRLNPDDKHASTNLGNALASQGKLDEAMAAYREAIRLRPDAAEAHNRLGALLCYRKREYAAAEIEFRVVVRLKPDNAQAHYHLGNALNGQGKRDEAAAEFREAIRLKPDEFEFHVNLGIVLCDVKRDYPAAEAEFRAAIRLKPDFVPAHFDLGVALVNQGKHDEAIAAWREAIRLKPDAYVHYRLGTALMGQGELDQAAAAYHAALKLNPEFAEVLCNLGQVLQRQGDYAGAVAMLRKGHELGSRRPMWPYPSARCLAEAERDLALADRLAAVLRGEDKPADNAERLAFARMAHQRKHFAAAVRLWAEALASDPQLGGDRRAGYRYSAACTAALAGSGQGTDDPKPDGAARARLRGQALDWLKAERAAWAKVLDAGDARARSVVAQNLRHWQANSDLAGVRDRDALAKLPADERRAWEALWKDVDALLKGAMTSRGQERSPAILNPNVEPNNPEALAVIHRRAHELAGSKPGEAEPLFRRALEGYRKIQGPDGALTLDLTMDLAGLLDRTGRGATAEPLFREAMEQARKRFGPDDHRTAGIMATFGLSLVQQGKWDAAGTVLRESLAIREKSQPDDWTTFNTRSLLGGSLLGQKKYAEAEPLIVAGYEGLKAREAKIPPPGKPRFTDAAERVVGLYEEWGKKEKAAEWRTRLAKPTDRTRNEP
jgi:tetratricopeptide (TPR) repeat protein